MIYFTSDQHFGHNNIIKYCNRPFDSSEHMTESLIYNYNKVVNNNDIVYMLGDVFLCNEGYALSILQRLKGKKHLIFGNHDRILRKSQALQSHFESCSDYKEISIYNHQIVLMHYALRVWHNQLKGSYHVYGHSHGNLPELPNHLSMDIGVDLHNYTPVSATEVITKLYKKQQLLADNNIKTADDYNGR